MPNTREIRCSCFDCKRPVKTIVVENGNQVIFEKRVHGAKHTFTIDKNVSAG